MNSTNNHLTNENPWIGLNSYSEGQALYGRDEEIEELSSRIQYNTQTVVYGRSGIGKSSILCAGIFPQLRENHILPIRIRLEHNDQPYLSQIKEVLFHELEAHHCTAQELVQRHTNADGSFLYEESLWEFFHRYVFTDANGVRIAPLVVLDQFEEIFTLEKDRKKISDFFVQLADLLNQTKPAYLTAYEEALYMDSEEQVLDSASSSHGKGKISALLQKKARHRTEFNYVEEDLFHIVLTIREDYLSYLERSTTHIPLLKHNRYCLQPINEEQAAKIIMQPCPGLVDKSTAKLIIEKVTGETDFELDGTPEISIDSAVLSLYLSRLYDKKGDDEQFTPTLIEKLGDDIINDFYTETISHYPQSVIQYLEDTLLNDEGHRENISVYNATHNCPELTEAMLDSLVNTHKLIRRFSYNDTIRIEFIHDILCPIIKARKERHEQITILQAAKRKLRILAACLCSVIILAAIVYLLSFAEYSQDYGNFTIRDGWPVGLGEKLSTTSDKEVCTIYYTLSRKGWLSVDFMGRKNPYTKVTIRNWKGEMSTNIFSEEPTVRIMDKELSDQRSAAFAALLAKVSYWIYTEDENHLISRKTAFDCQGKELYSELYSVVNKTELGDKYVLWSRFCDPSGNAMPISDKGTDRVRYTISNGYITGCSFFTQLGTPQTNTTGQYGYMYVLDAQTGYITSQCALDKFGDTIPQTETQYLDYQFGRYTKTNNSSIEYTKQQRLQRYTNYTDTIHIADQGFVDLMSLHTADGRSQVSLVYDTENRIVKKQHIVNQQLVQSYRYFYSTRLDSVYMFDRDVVPAEHTERYSYPDSGVVEVTGKTIACHKIRTTTSIADGRQTVTTEYLDEQDALTQYGDYAKSVIISDVATGNVLYSYHYDSDDEICQSEMFSYNEYGIRVSRAVAGIDGTPIRCPNWDGDGWLYYQMRFLKINYPADIYIATQGVDELGQVIPVVEQHHAQLVEVKYEEAALSMVNEMSNQAIILGESVSKLNFKMVTNAHCAPFVHLLSKQGTFYQTRFAQNNHQGLRDGDIILYVNGCDALTHCFPNEKTIHSMLSTLAQSGGSITIARVQKGEYVPITIYVPKGKIGAEYHIAPISDKAYQQLIKL